MRLVFALLLIAGVVVGRTYDALLTAETLALMTEEVLDEVGHYTRISLRGEQARPIYDGARVFWPDVGTPYLLGLWMRRQDDNASPRVLIVLAAPSGSRLHEWRLYAANADGSQRNDEQVVRVGELLMAIGARETE